MVYRETFVFDPDQENNDEAKIFAEKAGLKCDHPIVFPVSNFDPGHELGFPNFEDRPLVTPSGPGHPWGYFPKVTTFFSTVMSKMVSINLDHPIGEEGENLEENQDKIKSEL